MSEIRPSDDLFIRFWQDKYSLPESSASPSFRVIWRNFNEKYAVPEGRWDTAIAIMPNDKTAQRYKYLNGATISLGSRRSTNLGRNFGGSDINAYCSRYNFGLQGKYTAEEIGRFYNELCTVEFPETSFSNPTEFNYNEELTFKEYDKTHGDEYARATILEHIVFPYDYVASYPIPLFQPQASLYFLTRIREPKEYSNTPMPEELTREQTILLEGTSGAQGIKSFLNEFLTSSEFREWERSVNAELSVLRYSAFFKDLRFFLTKEKKNWNWTEALLQSLPTLIRGNIDTAGAKVKHIEIDLTDIIGQIFYINTESGWNKINLSRSSLLKQYRELVPEVVGLMKDISDKEAKEREFERQARMMELLEKPFHSLTEALNQTQKDTQQLRAILFAPQRGIFASQTKVGYLFSAGHTIDNPNNTKFETCHSPDDYAKKTNLDDARWVLAHAIAALCGRKLESSSEDENTAESFLKREVNTLQEAAKNNADPLHSYSHAVFHLLGADDTETTGDAFVKEPVKYLNTIKSRLFTPFKPEYAKEGIKWPVFHALNPKVRLGSAKLNDTDLEKENLNATVIIAVNSNPLVTHGHLLDFICGVVEANKSNDILVKLNLAGGHRTDPDSVTLTLVTEEDNPWIQNNKLEEFHKKLRTFNSIRRKNGRLPGEYGDFYRPFIVLLEYCDNLPKIATSTKILSLTLKWTNLEIMFKGSEFSISSKRGR